MPKRRIQSTLSLEGETQMSSILTNVGAMAALQSINTTARSLTQTQNHISTGLRVETAKDDSSTWAIATAMRGDVSGFKAISDNLALSTSTIGVASKGAETITSLLNQIKDKVVQANGTGVDTAKIQSDVDQLVQQIDSVANAAEFNGLNFIKATPDSANLLASMDRSSGSLAVKTIAVTGADLTSTGLSIGSLDVTSATALTDVETAIGTASAAAAQFGSVQNRLSIQSDFVKSLTDALTTGIGSLVDANMEEESARLSALQVQQQLGVQSLSIANSTPQSILTLFR
ncbi:MAG TPA: flagellin [Candidatus Angelobacter sp.]|nr:flagellin [Candidatus Angelobacter sp.]